MNLFLYFDVITYFKEAITFTNPITNDDMCLTICSVENNHENGTYNARAFGKKLILCKSTQYSNLWPFQATKKYEEFIIRGDIYDPIHHTCDPDKLSNPFGKNPQAPDYLTPIFFKKNVMQKYYNSPENYEINDGILICKGAWSLHLDKNLPQHISAFLGDLGRDLPHKEQLYWKSYNICPENQKISQTSYERNFLANFFDAENPEHIFKKNFTSLQEKWVDAFGWHLFLPLEKEDQHFYSAIRSMLSNEQSEFDHQILAVVKVTIDSLNEKKLKTFLTITNENNKGIDLFILLLQTLGIEQANDVKLFLKKVQTLRSTGVAHRKGSKYQKALQQQNIDLGKKRDEFDRILTKFSQLFNILIETTSKKIKGSS